jgi:hypothetical protein
MAKAGCLGSRPGVLSSVHEGFCQLIRFLLLSCHLPTVLPSCDHSRSTMTDNWGLPTCFGKHHISGHLLVYANRWHISRVYVDFTNLTLRKEPNFQGGPSLPHVADRSGSHCSSDEGLKTWRLQSLLQLS